MSILKNTEAHPAHIQALGRSLHYQLNVCKNPLSRESFLDEYRARDTGRTDLLKAVLKACEEDFGIVRENVEEDHLEFAEGWESCFAPEALPHSLMLRISESLQKESDSSRDTSLYALCAGILSLEVLGNELRFSTWIRDAGADSPIKDTDSQRNDAQRWMVYLGWARCFGDRQYVPDLTRWFVAWTRNRKPDGRQTLREVWAEWCRALPPLAEIDVEELLPEPIGVALSALERRGMCTFTSESDSAAGPLQWSHADTRRTERFVQWESAS